MHALRRENGRDLEGIIFNIQRYSIHDGPGIRTTIFTKGCPLRCQWCDNPESQSYHPEIFARSERCDHCQKCLDVCSRGAIALDDAGMRIDRVRCDLCMKCVDVCLTGALTCVGKSITVEEVVREASKDELFYRNSGGGVTLSGGEPLYQEEFARNILIECKERSLPTVLDTCGYVHCDVLERVLEYVDLVLFDIKHLDSEIHHRGTGVGNGLILENFGKVAEKAKVWVRVPVIPNYNDSTQYIERLASFLSGMPVEKVSLLGYHEWGKHKYQALDRDYPLDESHLLDEEKLHGLGDIMRSRGLAVTTGY